MKTPKTSRTRTSTRILAGSIAALLAVQSAHALPDTWNNAGNGSWGTDANWLDGSKPTSADDVLLDNSNVTLPATVFLSASGGSTSFTINLKTAMG